MKIKLPKFPNFEDIYEEIISNDYDFEATPINSFEPWFAKITIDSIDAIHDCMYGYISTTLYYDDYIVATDDMLLIPNQKGEYGKTQLKRIYNQCVKELQSKYKHYIIENIMENIMNE